MANVGLTCFTVFMFVGLINAEACIQCNSERDDNCVRAPWLIEPTDCARPTADVRCYIRIVGQHTIRGCTDQLDQHVIDSCTSNESCVLCAGVNGGRGCNSGVFPDHRLACHQCTGNLNSNCSVEIISRNAELCTLYDSKEKCYIRKTSAQIERGCLTSSGTRCNNSTQCYTCGGHGCNYLNHSHPDVPTAPDSASLQQSSVLILCGMLVLIKLSY